MVLSAGKPGVRANISRARAPDLAFAPERLLREIAERGVTRRRGRPRWSIRDGSVDHRRPEDAPYPSGEAFDYPQCGGLCDLHPEFDVGEARQPAPEDDDAGRRIA